MSQRGKARNLGINVVYACFADQVYACPRGEGVDERRCAQIKAAGRRRIVQASRVKVKGIAAPKPAGDGWLKLLAHARANIEKGDARRCHHVFERASRQEIHLTGT